MEDPVAITISSGVDPSREAERISSARDIPMSVQQFKVGDVVRLKRGVLQSTPSYKHGASKTKRLSENIPVIARHYRDDSVEPVSTYALEDCEDGSIFIFELSGDPLAVYSDHLELDVFMTEVRKACNE